MIKNMKKQKTVKAWVFLKNMNTTEIEWEWFCFPFLGVDMRGITRTPSGAKRAAKRTIERLGFKASVKILWPRLKRPSIK